MQKLRREHRAPVLIVMENVCGALSSNEGRDFAAIGAAIAKEGYRLGGLIINAADFLPQSRPRLFIVAVRGDVAIAPIVTRNGPDAKWHSDSLIRAYCNLPFYSLRNWIWWSLPLPAPRQTVLRDLIEKKPAGIRWHSRHQTRRLLSLTSEVQRRKVVAAQSTGRCRVGTFFRRTRTDSAGIRSQRVEVRFDGLAGCLRTPGGGSSLQSLVISERNKMRSRLLSPREAARLMDGYSLPKNHDAYQLLGDGVAVPVVRYLSAHLLEPLLGGTDTTGGRQDAL